MSRQSIVETFGRAASTYDTIIPFFSVLGARLAERAALSPGERVMDLACGRGASLLPAADLVGAEGHIVGIDLAPQMLDVLDEELRRLSVPNADVTLMDAAYLAFPDRVFDVVLCGFGLHFLQPPLAVARGLYRVLKGGGRCVASAPTGFGSEWDFTKDLVERYLPRLVEQIPLPITPPEDFGIDQLLLDAGFDKVESSEKGFDFFFADPWEWWAWTWSQGMRGFLEALAPDALEELRVEAFEHVQDMATSGGIRLRQNVGFVTGWRT